VPPLPLGVTYVSVDGGLLHSVALRSDGTAIAWGSNSDGQCNLPPLPVGVTHLQVSAGVCTFALRSDGLIDAVGDNSLGQTNVPALPPGLAYVQVSGGAGHAAALRSDGSIICWGNNLNGQTDTPPLPPGLVYTRVAAGRDHTLGLRSDGTVVGWGLDSYGQAAVPPAPSGYKYVAISAEGYQSTGRIDTDPEIGTAYCFGDGSLPTPCPCVPPNIVPSPSGLTGHGCANSFDLDGARLRAFGTLAPDTATLLCEVGPNYIAFGFILKGNASDANGVASSDGIRCADGQLIRFGGHNAGTNGAEVGSWTYPNSVQTNPISAATLQPSGQSAYYQLFYRNAAPNFCTAATANFSNAVELVWP
jgi:hypothetical protein